MILVFKLSFPKTYTIPKDKMMNKSPKANNVGLINISSPSPAVPIISALNPSINNFLIPFCKVITSKNLFNSSGAYSC